MRTDREFAEALLNRTLERGAELAEVFVLRSRTLSAEARDSEVLALDNSESFAYSVRAIKDSRLGFSYSTDATEDDSTVISALDSLEFTERDEYLDLPSASDRYPELRTHDPEVSAIGTERAIEYAKLIEREAYDHDKRVAKTRKSSASFSGYDVTLLNSRGLSAGYSATFASAGITVAAEHKGDSQMGWGYDGGRLLSSIDFKRAGREAAARACSLLGAERAVSGNVDLIIDSAIAVEFLSVAASMLNAESVQKKRSLLAGKTGQAIMSRAVNIVDDPLRPGSPALKPMDGEGVPARKNVLVHGGILQGFMHNTYTARKDGLDSTGNAVRGGASTLPGVGAQGLIIEPSGKAMSMDSLISSIKKGLLVTDAMGVHTINPVSGEYSIGVGGIAIENGHLRGPVKEAVISGNILDFFSSIEALAGDLRFMGSMGSPSLLVTGIDLSA